MVRIGIDVGGSHTRLGARDSLEWTVTSAHRFETPQDYNQAISCMAESIRALAQGREIQSIGIGLPGIIDRARGQINRITALPDWQSRLIRRDLANATGIPVHIENDAVVAALGEALFGAAVDVPEFLYLTWGTSFGGAHSVRANERLEIRPIEPGHQIIEWNGRPCACGQRGCLAAYVGGKAFAQRHAHLISNASADEWRALAKNVAHGLINTLRHFPVPLVVLGGGVVDREPSVIEKIRDVLALHQTDVFPSPRLERAELGDDSGVYGGTALHP